MIYLISLISFGIAVSVTIQQPHMKPRRASVPTKYKWHEGAELQIRDLLDCHDSRLVSILHEDIDDINNSIEI